MSTQALLDKINQASADSITTIESEAAVTVAAITESTKVDVVKIADDANAAAAKAAAAVARATLAKARQTGKLAVQTARRAAFDAIMSAAKKTVLDGDDSKSQQFADSVASLELHLSKQLG
ncbi:MAG: vacuolar-type H+-ATPase subunit E/Vma4 [Candidatus Paceibacteria bacterium]|jgi:vacuolar-type H+-ATPase subunit E/Vma4